MKKAILLLALSSTFIMCKKGDGTTESLSETIKSADSSFTEFSDKAEKIQNETAAALDSAQVKIKEFDKTSQDLKDKFEKTASSVDSLGEKISNVKFESKTVADKDSAKKKEEKIVVNVPAPKVIKQTKIIYKNNSCEKPKSEPKYALKKTANLEIGVDDTYGAKNYIEDQLRKYDGSLKSENVSMNSDDTKTAYLKIQIPLDKFEYFVEDVSAHAGNVIDKTIASSGDEFYPKTKCDIEITLYGNEKNAAAAASKPESFGGKFSSGIGSGWEVLTGILLFFVPFWPLFLIAGIGYYFYKKNRNKSIGNTVE
ncbi:DUF4349 domain-containing protein [Chryseobacterium sp. Leaf394]|uniref:DUF4349 domain-containing protein n=1 Tax=Chryseobacterium sp. Leaf394 TaxID=1736361 RepID=UPI0006FC8C88|nr:DUF4349 domain-containing protein [Chryseobacterium sp. Leaf394]KQS91552.1 hypothetical protein ASG21_03520 [Chryseobacterium sp. Leaf394]